MIRQKDGVGLSFSVSGRMIPLDPTGESGYTVTRNRQKLSLRKDFA